VYKRQIEATISRRRKVIADSRRKIEKTDLKFIDIAENEVIETEFEVASTQEMEPLIVRERPLAYLLPREEKTAIANLIMLGLEIDSLEQEHALEVESYVVRGQLVQGAIYQGYYPNEVSTEVHVKERRFERGTYVIKLDQKNANLAVTALEPENDNGFVRTRVVEATLDEEVPIYRLMHDAEGILRNLQ